MRHTGWAAGLPALVAVAASWGAPLAPQSSAASVVDLATGACMNLEAGAPLRPGSIDPHVVGHPAVSKAVELKLDQSALVIPSTDGAVYFQVVGPKCQVRGEGVDPTAVEHGIEAALSGLEFRKGTPDATSARPDTHSVSYTIGDMGLPRIPAIVIESPVGVRRVEVTVAMMRQVNLTSDSAPGWQPSDEQADQAVATIRKYLAAEDSGSAKAAYQMMDEGVRQQMPMADYLADNQKFRGVSGRVVDHRIVRLTWTKDPAEAPHPGVYAAADLVSRYQNVDRHCGYIVAYQAPAGGAFAITREEKNYMPNAEARRIATSQSPAAVDQLWAQLSAHCPNYPDQQTTSADQARSVQATSPLPETESSIGYPTVAAALAALRARRDVVITTNAGWIVADDEAATTIWSFAPAGYPAYPAVVKRQLAHGVGGVTMQMSVLCEASKQACDDLVRTFTKLNAEMSASLRAPR